MNKFGKALLTLTSAVMLVGNLGSLAACSGGSQVSGSVKGDVNCVAYNGSKVTISFYHSMGQVLSGNLTKYIGKFNQMYPNIEIVESSFGDHDGVAKQVTTELTGGQAPSLAYCYPDHIASYMASGNILALDAFIGNKTSITDALGNTTEVGLSDAQINDFVPLYYDQGKSFGDGKMYTLPLLNSTEVLYYNKTYFEQKGYDIEETFGGIMTWDEMIALCREIKADPAEAECIPLGYDSEANWFITMCEQYGSAYTSDKTGEHFLFNNETNRTFMEKIRGWHQEQLVTTQEINGGYTSDLFTQTDKTKPHSYLTIGSSAGASYQCPDFDKDKKVYPFEVGVAMIPQVNADAPKVISQGPSICMFKKANEQEMAAAWLFMEFLTTNLECQAQFSMSNGYTSALKSLQNDEIYTTEFLDLADGNEFLQATCVLQTIAQRDYLYVSPAFNGSSAARTAVGELLQKCIATSTKNMNGKTVAEFIEAEFAAKVKKLEQMYGK